MNKIYKTKWNKVTGQRVAVSELASNSGKVNLKGVATVAAIIALSLGVAGVSQAAEVSKTNADAVGGVITVTEAELAAVGTVIGKGVSVVGSGANHINIEGGVANIATSGSLGYGIIAQVQAGGTGNITIGGVSKPLTGNITTGTNTSTHAIYAENYGTGGVNIYSSAKIDTHGTDSRGIAVRTAATSQGDIKVISSSNITLYAATNPSHGISIQNRGAGNIYIASSGNFVGQTTSNSNALFVQNYGTATGNINIGYSAQNVIAPITGQMIIQGEGYAMVGYSQGRGDINIQAGAVDIKSGVTLANPDSAIYALYTPLVSVTNKTSNILINVDQASIDLNGSGGGAAIFGEHQGDYGGITINSGADIKVMGTNTHGISASYTKVQNGVIDIKNAGKIDIAANQSHGINALNASNSTTLITNSAAINTAGQNSHAINVDSNIGGVGVSNAATLIVKGNNSRAIYVVNNSGDVVVAHKAGAKIVSTGDTTTSGQRTDAIDVQKNAGQSGNLLIIVDGDIETDGANRAAGAYAQSYGNGNAVVIGTGNVTAHATNHAGGINLYSYGLAATVDGATAQGNALVSYSKGAIRTNGTIAPALYAYTISGTSMVENLGGKLITTGEKGYGIWSRNYTLAGGLAAAVNTGSINTSGLNAHGIYGVSTNGSVDINNTGLVQTKGVGAYAINIESPAGANTHAVANSGVLDSSYDLAFNAQTHSGSSVLLNNTGTITGVVNDGDGDMTFTNYSSNSWNLRNFADTDGDGVRDTKAVAISDFGAGNDTFKNTSAGTVRLLGVSGETATVTTNEYVPRGALSPKNTGIVHAQLLNLETFDNAGTIDLTSNGLPGDVFVITGGNKAGNYGAGQYISNGGTLKLNTRLSSVNTATSDILVLDDITTAAGGATKIHVTPAAGSTGEVTTGDGIKIVEVLGNSPSNAFILGTPVSYGAYEYTLGQGLSSGNQNNWYLRNTGADGQPIINPYAGAYLSNQYASANMFTQNLLDRRESLKGQNSNIWARINHTDASTKLFGTKQKASIETTLFQVGADLLHKNNITAGLFGGYGSSRIDNKSNQTGSKASGKVDGYHIGAYASWLPDQNKGPYIDTWAYVAKFNNKLQAAGKLTDSKYNSTGYALSIEGGYAFELSAKENGNSWILKPHAQIIYMRVNADNFLDQSGTYYTNNKGSGFQTRLGARLYGQKAQGEKGVTPFIEANWLHNSVDGAVSMNVHDMHSDIGKNIIELKLGAQGQLTDKLSVWGHIGGQKGSGNFSRYEVQLGLGWQWK